MARASDNITIALTSTPPPSSPSTTSPDTPPIVQVQSIPFSSDSDSSHAYPHSPALHTTSSAMPIITLPINLDGEVEQQGQQVYPFLD